MSGVPGEDDDVLRVDIPGYDEKEFVAAISWDGFFRRFEEKGLAFSSTTTKGATSASSRAS